MNFFRFIILAIGVFQFSSLASASEGICSKNYRVQMAIFEQIRNKNCDEVTAADLLGIQSLSITPSPTPLELAPEDFKGFQNLKTLTLYRVRLSSVPAGLFSELGELKNLNISSNLIKSLPQDIFLPLQNLEYLNLSNNPLTALSPETLAPLKKLKKFLLARSETLVSVDPLQFKENTQLEWVDLRYQKMTSLDSKTFFYNPNLKILNIAGSSIASLPMDLFANNPMLASLQLSNTNLILKDLSFIQHLKNLRSLGLTGLKIQSLTTDLNSFKLLENLYLANLNLSHFSVDQIKGLGQLKVIDLSGNPLAAADIAALSQLLGEKLYMDTDVAMLPPLKNMRAVYQGFHFEHPSTYYIKEEIKVTGQNQSRVQLSWKQEQTFQWNNSTYEDTFQTDLNKTKLRAINDFPAFDRSVALQYLASCESFGGKIEFLDLKKTCKINFANRNSLPPYIWGQTDIEVWFADLPFGVARRKITERCDLSGVLNPNGCSWGFQSILDLKYIEGEEL